MTEGEDQRGHRQDAAHRAEGSGGDFGYGSQGADPVSEASTEGPTGAVLAMRQSRAAAKWPKLRPIIMEPAMATGAPPTPGAFEHGAEINGDEKNLQTGGQG